MIRKKKVYSSNAANRAVSLNDTYYSYGSEDKQKRGLRKKSLRRIDQGILIPLIVLVCIGLLMVSSASTYTSVVETNGYMVFIKQLIFVAAGLLIMWGFSKINYRLLNNTKLALFLIILSGALLLLVLLVGEEINGAKRWLNFGISTFQPSELAKAAGCIYMAVTVSNYPEVTHKAGPLFLRGILPIIVLSGLTAVEPSLSAALAVAVPMAVILFLSIRHFKLLLPYIILAGIGIAVMLIVTPWRFERILVWFGGGTLDYQITQSLLAIGSGGILGKGLGNGIQKYLFLPELENDFIFANVGEEFGLWGCLLILILFALIVYRGLKQAMCAKDKFGFYYTSGLMVLIGFQVAINIGVAVSVLPVTGMALPFVSSGGSSIIILFAMMGPVLNLTRQTQYKTGLLTKVLLK